MTYLASIMHYKSTAFSKNGQATITPKANINPSTMGSSTVMTALDIEKVKAHYGCT